MLAAVEAAGLAASEKRKHPDKAVHSYNFDIEWYSPEQVWLVDLGKDLVYWLTDGRTDLPGFAPISSANWAAARTGGLSSEQGPGRSNSRICGS